MWAAKLTRLVALPMPSVVQRSALSVYNAESCHQERQNLALQNDKEATKTWCYMHAEHRSNPGVPAGTQQPYSPGPIVMMQRAPLGRQPHTGHVGSSGLHAGG